MGNFGPRLRGFIALATGRLRLSKRLVQELLEDVPGVEAGLGSVSTRLRHTKPNVDQERPYFPFADAGAEPAP